VALLTFFFSFFGCSFLLFWGGGLRSLVKSMTSSTTLFFLVSIISISSSSSCERSERECELGSGGECRLSRRVHRKEGV